ncbi:MAG: hypothetical protein QOD38_559 [Acidimicrobiaceae bacterium]
MTIAEQAWPAARLGPLARLRAIAAGLPGVHLHEEVIDAAFDDVWRFVSDLERTTTTFEPDVRSLRILERDAAHWKVRIRLAPWLGALPLNLDVTMQDGWCWMISRPHLYVVGMAAEPLEGSPTATSYGHLEGVVLPTAPWARAAAWPILGISRWRHRVHVPRDVARIAAHVTDAD